MKKRFLIFLIFIIIFCFQYGLLPFFGPSADRVRIIAHRGDSAHAPENTIPAFLSSMQNGVDCIELDIRHTRDRVPVVFHDANLRRLTGNNLSVSELTCREFLSYPITSSGITACTLEDALVFFENQPNLRLHLELKTEGMEEKVVSLLQKYDSVCFYEISSADPSILRRIKQLSPETETFLLLKSAGDILNYIGTAPEMADGISVKSAYVTATLVSLARERGHKIYVWTVNDAFSVRRLCRLGVNGIITDDPSLIRKMLS